MALATYPAVASPIKSIQRGSAAGAGSVTISTIVPLKSTIMVFGTTSSGTVSASFNMSMNAGSASLIGQSKQDGTNIYAYTSRPTGTNGFLNWSGSGVSGSRGNLFWNQTATVNAGTASVGAGSNNLVAAVITGYIQDATTIVVSGACRWEVVEYN